MNDNFEQIIKEYLAKEKMAEKGLFYKQKILLYGPPGCGKTLMAQQLAKQVGLPMFKTRLDALVESYLGDTSKNLKAIFDFASKQPSLLFLDECDALMGKREGRMEHQEMTRALNCLLQILDEYPKEGLIVAATNLQNQLDFALWRRFDEAIYMGKPKEKERKAMLFCLFGSNRWNFFSKQMLSCSYADIHKIYQNAAKTAFFENVEVNQSHIEKAIAKILKCHEKYE